MCSRGRSTGCEDEFDDSEQNPDIECDNGIDDDLDGAIDTADLGCKRPAWRTESPECQDGIDNDDDDDLIDFDGGFSIWGFAMAGSDPECIGMPFRRTEKVSTCGLGGEPMIILALLFGLRARRKRARS